MVYNYTVYYYDNDSISNILVYYYDKDTNMYI